MEDNIKMDLQEVGCGAWTELMWLITGTSSCEFSNKLSGSKKCGEFLAYMRTWGLG